MQADDDTPSEPDMKSLRRLVLLPLSLLLVGSVYAQSVSPGPEEQFSNAAAFMEKGLFAEAVPILEALAGEYENEDIFWNLGLAATEIHANDKALNAWLGYRRVAPNDWRGRAKLVQAYQAVGNLKGRDEERAALINLWEMGKDANLKKEATFCREQIIEANWRVFVLEHFRPAGEYMVVYTFEVRAPGAENYRISLGSYEGTNQVGWETGRRPRNVRLYHLDLYRPKLHETYGFYEGPPSYETVRAAVMSIIAGESNALSSTRQQ